MSSAFSFRKKRTKSALEESHILTSVLDSSTERESEVDDERGPTSSLTKNFTKAQSVTMKSLKNVSTATKEAVTQTATDIKNKKNPCGIDIPVFLGFLLTLVLVIVVSELTNFIFLDCCQFCCTVSYS